MTDDDVERLVATQLVRVNALSFGLACGLLAGLGLFAATNVLLLKGGLNPGPHLGLLGQYFPGYRVSFAGSLLGLAYGFASGLLLGAGGAWLYNRVAAWRQARGAP